jgi:uncharacterized protein YcbX
MRQVGVVVAVNRYPVKSMRGESLAEAMIRYRGIRGDRRFAFIQGHDHSSFPWLTGREVPRMVLYQPRLVDLDNPDESGVMVTTPDGRELDIFSDELAEELKGQLKDRLRNQPIYAVHLKSAHDAEPMSVVTTYALDKLSDRLGAPVDPRRFRQNLIIDTTGAAVPHEQTWIGGNLVIGQGEQAPVLSITRGDERCMMPNLDPDTAVQDPRVLRTIAQEQNTMMGVYAAVARQGLVRVGDPVYLITPEPV